MTQFLPPTTPRRGGVKFRGGASNTAPAGKSNAPCLPVAAPAEENDDYPRIVARLGAGARVIVCRPACNGFCRLGPAAGHGRPRWVNRSCSTA